MSSAAGPVHKWRFLRLAVLGVALLAIGGLAVTLIVNPAARPRWLHFTGEYVLSERDETVAIGRVAGIALPSRPKSVRTFIYEYDDENNDGPANLYVRFDLEPSDVRTIQETSWLASSESPADVELGGSASLPVWFDAAPTKPGDKWYCQNGPAGSSPSGCRAALIRASGQMATLYVRCDAGVSGFVALIPTLKRFETHNATAVRERAPRTFERKYNVRSE